MSAVLLWQPSDCIDFFVIDYIFVLFSENKYEEDDDGLWWKFLEGWGMAQVWSD